MKSPRADSRWTPILLACAGGSAVAVALAAFRISARERAGRTDVGPGDGAPSDVAIAVDDRAAGARIAMRANADASRTTDETADRASVAESLAVLQSPGSAKERELYAAFVELARLEPGALEARAETLLATNGPSAEKVAFLRALHDVGSADSILWLEHAVRELPDASSAHAESVPSFALAYLARLAPREPPASAALRRIAFDTQGVPVELRRRAVAHVAAECEAGEIDALVSKLYHEPDELAAAGAIATLRARATDGASGDLEAAADALESVHGAPTPVSPVESTDPIER